SLTAMLTTIFAVYNRTVRVGIIWPAVLIFYVSLTAILVPKYGTLGIGYALIIAFGCGFVAVAIAAKWLRDSVRGGLRVGTLERQNSS
ncbi:MAG: hypothetical protein AB1744_13035, partial [Candidatus Zixiibacteriota bacterium]